MMVADRIMVLCFDMENGDFIGAFACRCEPGFTGHDAVGFRRHKPALGFGMMKHHSFHRRRTSSQADQSYDPNTRSRKFHIMRSVKATRYPTPLFGPLLRESRARSSFRQSI